MPFNHKYTSKDVLHTLCMEYFGVWKYSVKCFLFGNIVLGWRMFFCGWTSQGTNNCEASSQADFILNVFLSKFLNFPKIS